MFKTWTLPLSDPIYNHLDWNAKWQNVILYKRQRFQFKNNSNNSQQSSNLSFLNFKLWTISGFLVRKFQRCNESSAQTVISWPSLMMKWICRTANSVTCRTPISTPGRPKLWTKHNNNKQMSFEGHIERIEIVLLDNSSFQNKLTFWVFHFWFRLRRDAVLDRMLLLLAGMESHGEQSETIMRTRRQKYEKKSCNRKKQ